MKVSVIIPVYNVEKYLCRCLDSVARQTIFATDPEVEVECILVDDCGTDSSMHIAHEYIASYQGPVKWLIATHDRNRGLAAARNTGFDKATGDYVLFVDSDDDLPDDALRLLTKEACIHPGVDLVQGVALFSDPDSFPPGTKLHLLGFLAGVTYCDNEGDAFKYFISYRLPGAAWNKLVRRQFFINHNLRYLEDIRMFEDWEWCFRSTQKVKTLALVHSPTYNYAVGVPGSLTQSSKVTKMNTWKRVYKEVFISGAPRKYSREAAYRLIGNWFFHHNVVPGLFDDINDEFAAWVRACGLRVPSMLLKWRGRVKSHVLCRVLDGLLYRVCSPHFVHPLV